jgi:hypothetical protein
VSDSDRQAQRAARSGFSGMQVFAMLVGTILLTAVLAGWLITRYVLPTELEEITLTRQEQIELDRKLEILGVMRRPVDGHEYDAGVAPEPYTEAGAPREIEISEREINSLLSQDPQWRSRVAIDLSPDLVSLTALVPVPDDFPIMAGKSVRVRAGAEFSFRGARPVLMLKGVSVMGVPLPDAWLGNMKNIDLIAESGNEGGFWKAFADGIDYVEVGDGKLEIHLKE